MDDARAGLPESDSVLEKQSVNDVVLHKMEDSYFGRGSGQKVINLPVQGDGASQVLGATDLCLNQMVAVDCSRDGNGINTGGHELEESHLKGYSA